MTGPNEHSPNSTPIKNAEKPSVVESQPLKTKSGKTKVLEQNPISNGSPSFKTIDSSEIEKRNISANTPKSSKKKEGMPVPKDKTKSDRTAAALKRLGITPEQLAAAPRLTAMLKEDAKGGLKTVLSSMRFTPEDPDIGSFLEKYDSLPVGDRDNLPWEAIALAAGVNVRHLYGAIGISLREYSAHRVRTIITTNHPAIMKARVQYGLLAGGEKDRTAIDIISGALPSPKGPTFIGKAIFGAGQGESGKASEDEAPEEFGTYTDTGDYDNLFPNSELMQEKLITLRQKLLE